jgi:hypothetical protein
MLDTSALIGGLAGSCLSADRQEAAAAAAATASHSVTILQGHKGERLEAVNFLSSWPIYWPVGNGAVNGSSLAAALPIPAIFLGKFCVPGRSGPRGPPGAGGRAEPASRLAGRPRRTALAASAS